MIAFGRDNKVKSSMKRCALVWRRYAHVHKCDGGSEEGASKDQRTREQVQWKDRETQRKLTTAL